MDQLVGNDMHAGAPLQIYRMNVGADLCVGPPGSDANPPILLCEIF